MKLQKRNIAYAVLLLGYACFALSLGNAPMQDVPNHLARAHIIADQIFGNGSVYAQDFHFQFAYRPYLAVDLVLAAIDHFLGTSWAARLWIAVAVLLLPFGVRSALLSLQVPRGSALAGSVLSLYLATGWTFTAGFLNYEIALACALFTYSWFVRAQDSNAARVWGCYALMAMISYGMHLSALIFICAFVGTTAACRVMQRKTTLGRAAALLAVPVLLLGAHYCLGSSVSPAGALPSWGSLHRKLTYLMAPAIRFNPAVDLSLFAAFVCTALAPLARQGFLDSARRALPQWLCVGAFIGLYFVLPYVADNIYHVDLRALPYALVFLLFAGAVAGHRAPGWMRVQFAAACLVAAVNLVYVAAMMKPQDELLARYREIAAATPAGAHLLPVDTRPAIGRYRPFFHAGSYATLDARSMTPYLFAADLNPPMSYFTYTDGRDYAPYESWYEDAARATPGSGDAVFHPDWEKIEQQYQYLLVTVPWDPALIPAGYTEVVRNDVAALLRIPQP